MASLNFGYIGELQGRGLVTDYFQIQKRQIQGMSGIANRIQEAGKAAIASKITDTQDKQFVVFATGEFRKHQPHGESSLFFSPNRFYWASGDDAAYLKNVSWDIASPSSDVLTGPVFKKPSQAEGQSIPSLDMDESNLLRGKFTDIQKRAIQRTYQRQIQDYVNGKHNPDFNVTI